MMVPAAQLERMRATARQRMTSRAVILRATPVETETGARIDYLPVSPVVACAVRDPTVGAELVLAGRIQASSVVTVLLPLDHQGLDVTVEADDRIQVTTDAAGVAATATVEVTGVAGRLSDYPILQRAVCQVIG